MRHAASVEDLRRLHAENSVLRETIVEHIFAGELLRRLWQFGILDTEILKSEFDNAGYDLVLTCRQITRHIQLKVTRVGGARSEVNVNLRLAEKPSGCVIWISVDDDLNLKSYRWFGGTPGQPLLQIANMGAVKHTKGNAQGTKAVRPGHRSVKASAFTPIENLDDLLLHLLGSEILTVAKRGHGHYSEGENLIGE